MKKTELVYSVAREWIRKAENDLKTASHMLKLEDDCPTDIVCFHAQQCAEKYLKAYLVCKGKPFSKTHNLSLLMALLPGKLSGLMTEDEQDLLTDYAIAARYPGDPEEPALAEARKAARLARRVRKDLRSLMPKEVLSRLRGK